MERGNFRRVQSQRYRSQKSLKTEPCHRFQHQDRETSDISKKPKEKARRRKNFEKETKDHRLLLIGKTGNGKSSTGNTILKKPAFKVTRGIVSETREANQEKCGNLMVVDTPDICMEEFDNKHDDVKREVEKWRIMTSPGPTAVLLVVRADVRYTPEEHVIYKKTMAMLGEHLKDIMIVVFTMKDNVQTDVEKDLQTTNERLKSVLADAGHRHVIFDNTATPEIKDSQVDKLMRVINDMLEGNMVQRALRPILLGMTGSGRSATGNSLFGRHEFQTSTGMVPCTMTCKRSSAYVNGRFVEVLDTPGLNITRPQVSTKDEVHRLIASLDTKANIVLYVTKLCDRFTYHEEDYLNAVKQVLKTEIKDKLIVVFTGGDKCTDLNPGNILTKVPPELQYFLSESGNRYVIFDNETDDGEKKLRQRDDLFFMMTKIVDNYENINNKNGLQFQTIQDKQQRNRNCCVS